MLKVVCETIIPRSVLLIFPLWLCAVASACVLVLLIFLSEHMVSSIIGVFFFQPRHGSTSLSWLPYLALEFACWTHSWKSITKSNQSSSVIPTCAFAARSDFSMIQNLEWGAAFISTLTCDALFLFIFILTAFPLGRWQQNPFPQPSCECASWRLWESSWVNFPSRPHHWHRDQSSSAAVTGPQFHSQFTAFVSCIYRRVLDTEAP